MKATRTEEWFTKNFALIHDESQYDLSKVNYVNYKSPIDIFCKVEDHGWFTTTARNLIERRKGCPYCSGSAVSTPMFIKSAKIIHGDKYDYTKTLYVCNRDPVTITCPTHGDFQLAPSNHIANKQGCKKCAHDRFRIEYRKDLDHFIERATKTHGLTYDYSKSVYIDNKTDIEIICSLHGSFWQIPNNHCGGQGCYECGKKKLSIIRLDTKESFIEKARVLHGDKYEYSLVEYVDCKTPIKLVCPVHGEFYQKPMHHLRGSGCQSCSKVESRWEIEMKEYIRSLGFTADKDKTLINPFELDILVAGKNIAIEANGLFWHSEQNDQMNEKYHLNKTELCATKGVNLIHIFEDEWHNKQQIIKSLFDAKLGLTKNKIFARKCELRQISNVDANQFMENNHLQGGNMGAEISLALFYDDQIVSVMTFCKSRFDKNIEWELLKFCNKINMSVVGGASRLLNRFIQHWNPSSIVSYANRRFSSGELYIKLGFTFSQNTDPAYFYIHKDELKRHSRQQFQKHKLEGRLDKYDDKLSEVANMKMNNYYRIWDCGNMKFVWNKK